MGIHVSSWPEPAEFQRDEATEAEIALMMNVVKQVRSLRGEYKLTNKQKTKTFLEVKSDEAKKVLDSYSDFIRVLTNAEEIGFTKDIPAGCVLTVVNDDVNAHVLLKGVIDFEKEVVKMEKSRKGIENKISSQEKIESLRIELSEMDKAIEGIKKMLI